MHRIDGPGATAQNLFTEGDPQMGVAPTTVTDDWSNDVQEELATVIEGAGIALVKGQQDQLGRALGRVLFDAGNSGAAITIDWTDSPYQKLTLTGHCLITFANPQPGMRYTLLLVQDGSTAFRAYLPGDVEWKDGAPVSYIAPGTVAAVELLHASGIIAARAAIGVKIADPLTLPANLSNGIAYSPDGRYMGVAHATTPFVSVYRRDPATGRLIYRVATPTTLPTGQGNGIAWNPDGTALGVAHSTAPFVTAWEWADGFGAKYANPVTLPAGIGFGIAWSPDGTTLGVAHATAPFVTAWPWAAGFGAKYANPVTLPAGIGRGIAWSPDGTALGVAHDATPCATVWPWAAGFGAKYADPVTLPANNGSGIAWSPDGTAVGVAHDATPFVTVWPWAAGFGAKYADPVTLPASAGFGIAWSPDGTALGVAHLTTPFSSHYPSPRAARSYLGLRRL
jgi:hypothetical protein